MSTFRLQKGACKTVIIKTEAVTKNGDLHLNPPLVPEDFFLAMVGCLGVGSRPTANGRRPKLRTGQLKPGLSIHATSDQRIVVLVFFRVKLIKGSLRKQPFL